jgi:hypothetical protein
MAFWAATSWARSFANTLGKSERLPLLRFNIHSIRNRGADQGFKARLLLYLQQIEESIRDAHPKQEKEGLSDGQVMVLAMLAVSRNNVRGVRILLKQDHSEQARIVVRTLRVDCMRMVYLFDRLDQLYVACGLGPIRHLRLLVDEWNNATGLSNEAAKAYARIDEYEQTLFEQAERLDLIEEDRKREIPRMTRNKPIFDVTDPPGSFYFRFDSNAVHTSQQRSKWSRNIRSLVPNA